MTTMTNRERYFRTMNYESVDHRPIHLVGAWDDTLERWYREGLPRGADMHAGLGMETLHLTNISVNTALDPPYSTTGPRGNRNRAHLYR